MKNIPCYLRFPFIFAPKKMEYLCELKRFRRNNHFLNWVLVLLDIDTGNWKWFFLQESYDLRYNIEVEEKFKWFKYL